MAKTNDVKGEFLVELIEGRNKWLSKMEHGNPDNEMLQEIAMAYERLIFAFTMPPAKEEDKK